MKPLSREDIDRACGSYSLCLDEALQQWIARNPGAKTLTLTTPTLVEFSIQCGSRWGTLYPFKDGGVMFPGPYGYVHIRGELAP